MLAIPSVFDLSMGRSVKKNTKNGVFQPCNHDDVYAPCAFKIDWTNVDVHVKNGSKVNVDFEEIICDEENNIKRVKAGKIPVWYKCTQLQSCRVLYRDSKQNPIEVTIAYKAGCELRCVNENCEKENLKDRTKKISRY